MNKKRILVVNEFSELATGFSTLMKYLLPILHSRGDIELAEHASYIDDNNSLINNVPWKVYGNLPNPNSPEQQRIFQQGGPINQFGRWKFDEICLDFKPDIVLTVRDPWFDSWIAHSPFRQHFKWIWMLTCDGEFQKPEWLLDYESPDILLTYSVWAKNVLEQTSGGKLNVFGVATPCPDTNIFKPHEDRDKARSVFGLDPNAFIFTTVMRNQPRKLYTELLLAFNRYLEICEANGRADLALNSYMYWHTSYPDVGWDIATELSQHRLSHKVLFTYICANCKNVVPSFFNGDVPICRRCFQTSSHMPNTTNGVTRDVLSYIMGLSDMYIQYSCCLGKEEEVLTENGWKIISNCQVGEKVFTQDGSWKEILEVIQNEKGGREVYKISLDSDIDTLTVTEDHEILGLYKEKQYPQYKNGLRETLGGLIHNNKAIFDPIFVETKDIKVGDLIASKIDYGVTDISKIDIKEFANDKAVITDNTITMFRGDEYSRYIDVDNKFCKFIGLYVADGSSTDGQSVKITQHLDEIGHHKFIRLALKKLSGKFASTSKYKDRKAIDIAVSSVLHVRTFIEWCKSGKEKQLPDWYYHLPVDKQLFMLQGLFMGDGCFYKRKGGKTSPTSVYCTISKKLAEQIKHILWRNHMYFNLHIDYKDDENDGKNRQPQYTFEIQGDIAKGDFDSSRKRRNVRSLYHNGYIYRKVKSIEKINYESNDVYCLHIKDNHNFTSKIGIVHNSEGLGMPLGEAKACGVPVMAVDHSAMTEQALAPGGTLIKTQRLYQEPAGATNQWRALPDIEDTAQKMFEFACKPKEERMKIGLEGREFVQKYYNWDDVSKVWEAAIDSFDLPDHSSTWLSRPRPIKPNTNIPPNLTNEQFIEWCYKYILCEPKMVNSYIAQRAIASLNLGYEPVKREDGIIVRNPIDRNKIVEGMIQRVKEKNGFDQYRYDLLVANNVGQRQNFIQEM